MADEQFGFIGLGNMGQPMARHVKEAGHDLIVHDLAGTADRAGSRIETTCYLAVSQRLARRNFAHHLPDAPAKLTALDSQRKVERKQY